jgi:Tol biopolymer transport system component
MRKNSRIVNCRFDDGELDVEMTRAMGRKIGTGVLATACAVTAGGQAAAASAGHARTVRVSVSSSGQEADGGSSNFAVSGNGRYIVFVFVAGDTNGVDDVFLRDRKTGRTSRISVTSAGGQADEASASPTISRDGRFVAFTSSATNLVPGDTNGYSDIFIRNLSTGTLKRVSAAAPGGSQDQDLWNAVISGNGRYVSFSTPAPLVAGDDNGAEDVFVNDLNTGETSLVSGPPQAGTASNGDSYSPSMSGDGRYVAFASWATNLVGGDTNSTVDIFLRDRSAVSDDGRYVAFWSDGADYISDILVRDVRLGTTTSASVSPSGERGNNNSAGPSLSADGRYVTFGSWASNLVDGDTSDSYDIFVRDLRKGSTTLASVSASGAQGEHGGDNGLLSADGRHIVFDSFYALVPDDTNGQEDIFVRDRT